MPIKDQLGCLGVKAGLGWAVVRRVLCLGFLIQTIDVDYDSWCDRQVHIQFFVFRLSFSMNYLSKQDVFNRLLWICLFLSEICCQQLQQGISWFTF